MTDESSEVFELSFEDATTDELTADVEKATASSNLASAVVNELELRNSQRKTLFRSVVVLVWIGFGALLLLIVLLGFGCMTLPTGVAVAAISALGIQPFVLIGILTKGVYQGAPKRSGES